MTTALKQIKYIGLIFKLVFKFYTEKTGLLGWSSSQSSSGSLSSSMSRSLARAQSTNSAKRILMKIESREYRDHQEYLASAVLIDFIKLLSQVSHRPGPLEIKDLLCVLPFMKYMNSKPTFRCFADHEATFLRTCDVVVQQNDNMFPIRK